MRFNFIAAAFLPFCFASLLATTFADQQIKCDYAHCPTGKPNYINVHLVSHTHDDVGWLKTVDQYYYGARTNTQRAGVQYILDTVIPALVANPDRRFIYVETAFFWKWWKEQSNTTKQTVVSLVQQGRFEFIGGGWCMNDEAAAHYNAIIDQMTLGHKILVDNFGKCGIPKVAWQIDPFGHSREQALLFAKMNFDGLFFGRLDWADKTKRSLEKTMELVWKGSDEQGISADLFTGVLPNGYNPPSGFCFDDTCGDDPIIDDPFSDDYNVQKKVSLFINETLLQAKLYATNSIIMTMGSDFQYQNAHIWFKNLDKLIKYVNQQQNNGSKVNVFYSTPSCYLYSLNKADRTWPTKDDDFLPYSSDPHAYWTGYFTSRPSQKGYIRNTNNFLQIAKQLQVFARLDDDKSNQEITLLKQAMGTNQHHDAITGTEKQHVAYDYDRRLYRGVKAGENVISKSFQKLMSKRGDTLKQSFCLGLNISECEITENLDSIAVTIYNPVIEERQFTVRLPWTSKKFAVFDPNGNEVTATLQPIPDYVRNIPGRKSDADHELVFDVSLPHLGFATFNVHKKATKTAIAKVNKNLQRKSLTSKANIVKLTAKGFTVDFDANSGTMRGIQMNDGSRIFAKQSFKWYAGMNGDNLKFINRASGAYVFRPNGTYHHTGRVSSTFHEGHNFVEIRQRINGWIGQTMRVDSSKEYIEFDWVIGPIPIDDNVGKEIVSLFETNLKSNKTFYTDSNGRQILKRVRNYRKTWSFNVTEPVSGNYYPVNSRIFIRDEQQGLQVTVLSDRSQGGSSINDGSFELMVHRRLLHDDAFGVGESLNETGVDGKGLVIRGKHYLIPSKIEDAARLHRKLAQKIFMAPLISFSKYSADYPKKFKTQDSFANPTLPENIHLLTLEQWDNGRVLLRLEHYFESHDDPSRLSKPVKVDLRTIFKPFKITNAVETTLSANQLSSAKRLHWKTANATKSERFDRNNSFKINDDLVVTLTPMEIRTFIVSIQ